MLPCVCTLLTVRMSWIFVCFNALMFLTVRIDAALLLESAFDQRFAVKIDACIGVPSWRLFSVFVCQQCYLRLMVERYVRMSHLL